MGDHARFIKPLDEETLLNAPKTDYLITLEENVLAGGFGSLSWSFGSPGIAPSGESQAIGVPDVFVEHGDNGSLYRALGLDVGQLVEESF